MNRVARPPLRAPSSRITASLLLLVSLGVTGGSAGAKPATEAPIRWLPVEAMAAYAIDFAALRSSPHFGAAIDLFEALGESGPVHTDRGSGLHPSEHVDRVAAVFLESGHTLYAIEGAKLDESGVRAFFASKAPARKAAASAAPATKTEPEPAEDKAASPELGDKPPGEPFDAHDGMLVAFVGEHTAIVGKPADVRKTLRKGVAAWAKGAAKRGKAWKAKLSDVSRDRPFWFDSRAPSKKSRWVLPSHLKGLRRAFGSGTLDSDAHLDVKMRCDRAEDCERLADRLVKERDQIRGRIALRLAGVGAIADGIAVKHEGESIDVAATWASGQLRSMLGLGPKLVRLIRH